MRSKVPDPPEVVKDSVTYGGILAFAGSHSISSRRSSERRLPRAGWCDAPRNVVGGFAHGEGKRHPGHSDVGPSNAANGRLPF